MESGTAATEQIRRSEVHKTVRDCVNQRPIPVYPIVAVVCISVYIIWQLGRSMSRPSSGLRIASVQSSSTDDVAMNYLRVRHANDTDTIMIPGVGPLLSSVMHSVARVKAAKPLSSIDLDTEYVHMNKTDILNTLAYKHANGNITALCNGVPYMDGGANASRYDNVPWGMRTGGYRHLVVVGTGGVGSSYVMAELHNAIGRFEWKMNRYHDAAHGKAWKHHYPGAGGLHWLQLACWGADRVIYLFNDPVAQIQSLYRRDYGKSIVNLAPWMPVHRAAFMSMEAYVQEVLTHSRDVGGFQQHMMAWINSATPCPILVADSRTLLSNMHIVADYLAVPAEALANITWKGRRSNGLAARDTLPKRFLDLYSTVYEQMRLFDMTLVIPEDYVDPVDLQSVRNAKVNASTLWDCRAAGNC